MKKLLWLAVLLAIIGFIVWSKDPLDQTINFVIGGIVPGTKFSLGFWPMMGLIGLVVYLMGRGLRNTRLQMLENTAKQIEAETPPTHLNGFDSDVAQFDTSKRSVIAPLPSK